MKLFQVTLSILIASFLVSPAAAETSDAVVVMRVFNDACIPRVGKPNEVRAWAQAKHFPEITKKEILDVFVGPGNKGIAWEIPTPRDKPHLAVAIRSTTEACTVWAERADPHLITALFTELINGIERPGINVTKLIDKNESEPTSAYTLHTLMYKISGPSRPVAYSFILKTANNPGALFQATIQVAVGKNN